MNRSSLLSLLAASTLCFAQSTVPQSRGDLELTIYNDNRIFVHERREAKVNAGKQRLVFEGVAGSVISASVIPTFSGIETRLYSQNYSYDLISLPSLLRHSVGKEVSFLGNGKEPARMEGTLLAYKPSVMVREKNSGEILTLEKPSQLIFREIPPGMHPRPSLIWEVECAQAGTLGIDLKYLATGVSWKSDYVLNLAEDTFELTGWITVNNRSGVSYPNAKITCLAGEVHKVQAPKVRSFTKALARMEAAPQVQEESFSGYHIYKIPFRQTLANNEQKQIRFLYKSGVKYRSYGKARIDSFPRAGVQKLRFVNTVAFRNSKEEGLGLPLPAGTVRMYRQDSGGATRFIGESRLGNIPADENVTLQVGVLFDAVGEKKIVKYVSREGYRNVETLYTLHNRGTTPLTLKIEERIPVHGDRITLRSDCTGPCRVRKLSAFVREFTVTLPPKESYRFHSEFEVWN